jgi:hypothetical protein
LNSIAEGNLGELCMFEEPYIVPRELMLALVHKMAAAPPLHPAVMATVQKFPAGHEAAHYQGLVTGLCYAADLVRQGLTAEQVLFHLTLAGGRAAQLALSTKNPQ